MTDESTPGAFPLDHETLLQLIGAPEQLDAALDLADCEICRSIPDRSWLLHIPSRDVSYGGYPLAFAPLHDLIEVSHSLAVKRCPRCGRLYSDEYHYEYLAGDSEDEHILTRITRAQAWELLAGLVAQSSGLLGRSAP
jgi:hypothetical protein